MKQVVKIIAAAALALLAASCGKKAGEMAQSVENIKTTCTPEVLELVGNKIPVKVSVTYPKGYFHQEAMMVVTPVLIYEGGQQTGTPYIYQGEKIKDNYKVVPFAGGTVTETMEFDFIKGMEKSYLELKSVVILKDKKINLPTIKVADGCNTTCMLVDTRGAYTYRSDEYQEKVVTTTEGQILYDVNSATVKGSQLSSESINTLKATLRETQDSERGKITGTRIIAYASPEGGEDLNNKLSDKRADSAQQAWKSIAGGIDASAPEVKSVGQDWEGFQEAVAKSDIRDKDLILRVLSMYSDPAVRESEIKNMSAIYSEISEEVFPELRRARFITTTEYQNYTEEELKKIAERRMYVLDEEAVLRVASVTDDPERKALLYRLAAERFGSERGLYNLAMTCLDGGKHEVAEAYLEKIANPGADVLNALGVVQLRRGKFDEAAEFFKKSASDDAKANLAAIDIIRGNYAEAANALSGTGNANEALADILTGKLDAAASAIKGDDARSEYLSAIVAARKGKTSVAKSKVESAGSKDASLKERAAKDVEFAGIL